MKNISYLDKFTLRKVQDSFNTPDESLPDSLEAWMSCYLRLAVKGIRSEEVEKKRLTGKVWGISSTNLPSIPLLFC